MRLVRTYKNNSEKYINIYINKIYIRLNRENPFHDNVWGNKKSSHERNKHIQVTRFILILAAKKISECDIWHQNKRGSNYVTVRSQRSVKYEIARHDKVQTVRLQHCSLIDFPNLSL